MIRQSSAPFGELLSSWRTRCNLTQTALANAVGAHRNTISRWERGEVLPETRGMVLELARQLRLTEQEARLLLEASLTAVSPHWSVPLPRNPCFTGRKVLLSRLHSHLTPSATEPLRQAIALSGLGGIGKTQLALEYAYRDALEFSGVFWLAAETLESLMGSVQRIAEELQLPERQSIERAKIVAAVQRWLASHTGWLMIADNVEDLDLLQGVLPATRQGALLFTTRHQTLGTLAEMVEVPPLTNDEGVMLVFRRAHHPDTRGAGGEVEAAEVLANLLEGLPLALDQAGAYLDETGCGIAEYVRRYHAQRKQVLAYRGLHGGAHPASVVTTLQLAVDHVGHLHPTAADLLRLCAFLHPENIPEELLHASALPPGAGTGEEYTDSFQFDLELAALRTASLVNRHTESQTLSIHRLVQAVLQDQLEPTERRQWSERAVRLVNAMFPDPEVSVWDRCERYLPHALACASLEARTGGVLPEAGEVLYKAGSYLLERGRYQEAEPLLKQAVALEQQQDNHQPTVFIARLLKQAELLWKQGAFAQAEAVVEQLLSYAERSLGPDHRLVAEILDNLAILYCDQGKYREAEPLYLRALKVYEQECGEMHPDTGMLLNNLALLYRRMGKYEQAESLYTRSLRIKEQQLGTDHPRTLATCSNLAMLFHEQGKLTQAEALYSRFLPVLERAVGKDHPTLAHSLLGYANLCKDQGKLGEAEPLYRRALQIWEAATHPHQASALNGLADLYVKREQYVEAEALYQRALHMREQHLGETHPDTVTTLVGLAALSQLRGNESLAETLYQRALARSGQQPGFLPRSAMKIRREYQALQERARNGKQSTERKLQKRIHQTREHPHHHLEARLLSPETGPAVAYNDLPSLNQFLERCCELQPQAWSRASDLWEAYLCWNKEHLERYPLSRRAFAGMLKSLGCRADRTSTTRLWRGIALVSRALTHDDVR